MAELFREFRIWKRDNDKCVVIYQCFQSLSDEKFAVQSVDFISYPVDSARLHFFHKQAFELFMDSSPRERCIWFETLEEAIANHDSAFAG